MKRETKIVLAAGIVALVALGTCKWIDSSRGDRLPYHPGPVFTSQDGQNHVVVSHSDAQWSFGASKVKVEASSENGGSAGPYETIIGDDGGPGRIDVTWVDNGACVVSLDGCEQKPETVTVTFSAGDINITTTRSDPT